MSQMSNWRRILANFGNKDDDEIGFVTQFCFYLAIASKEGLSLPG
jgi:hypothetical protein